MNIKISTQQNIGLVIYLLLNPPGPLITWVQIILGCIRDQVREGGILLPAKLTTTIKNIDIKVTNQTYGQIIKDFYEYLQKIDTSENYQNGLLKVLIRYAEYIGKEMLS